MKWNRQRTLWVGQLSAFTTCFLYFGKGLKPANTTRCEKNHLSSLWYFKQPSLSKYTNSSNNKFIVPNVKWNQPSNLCFLSSITHDEVVYIKKRLYCAKHHLHKSSDIRYAEISWSTYTIGTPKT